MGVFCFIHTPNPVSLKPVVAHFAGVVAQDIGFLKSFVLLAQLFSDLQNREGSENSDSVVRGSLALPKLPAGGEPEARGDEDEALTRT